jgi:flagellar protein FliO/FliZ
MKSHTFIRGAALAGALTLAHAATASAASAGENTPLHLGHSTTVHVSTGGSSGIVRTIVGLFVVIAVIYGVAWVLRMAKRDKNRSTGQGLSQVASLPLGGGRSVALVRAGQELVLVGVAEHSVTPIRTYSEEEARELGVWDEEDEPARERTGPRRLASRPNLVDNLRRLTVRS